MSSSEKDSCSQQVPSWQPAQLDAKKTAEHGVAGTIKFVDLSKKIYARSVPVKSHFARWRIVVLLATQFIFFCLPWFQWNDRQAVLFDIASRKFYIFGLVLWPQDVFYLAWILIISAYGLFLFTALAGRLFCGYACPQTVYTEVFMWVERWVEGDRSARMRLDQLPNNFKKIRIKATKFILWGLIAFWTGFTFVGWFTPIREAFIELIEFDLSFTAYIFILIYGGFSFIAAGVLRESVCLYMCPYARFQSVMIDPDTLVVTYDKLRGEPRGKRSKKVDHRQMGLGDCIDCTICVQVCPTGIDIRDGLQYMCIGCGACIDACNDVMDKMNYPRGLIRYTSENGMLMGLTNKQARQRLARPRVFVYIALLCIFIVAIITSLSIRNDIRMTVIRDRGVLGREIPGGLYENVYQVQLINMTERARIVKVTAEAQDLPQTQVSLENRQSGDLVTLPPFANTSMPMVVRVPVDGSKPGLHDMHLKVESTDDAQNVLRVEKDTTYYVPK